MFSFVDKMQKSRQKQHRMNVPLAALLKFSNRNHAVLLNELELSASCLQNMQRPSSQRL